MLAILAIAGTVASAASPLLRHRTRCRPLRDHPISISREEFDDALQLLAEAGTRRKEDRERAWLDFRGWWATDDTVLLQLANITMAPTARWTSDRSIASRHTAVPRVWRSPHGDGRRTSR